jgi:hypothetical protein
MRVGARWLVASTAAIVVAAAGVALGQTDRGVSVLPPVLMAEAVRVLEPPNEAGAWALRVITRGGFAGRRVDMTIRSDGTTSLSTTGDAPILVQPYTLMSLGQHIREVTASPWTVESRLSTCSDCTATLIVLAVRTQEGPVNTHMAFWDVTTKSAMPVELLRIHELAVGM